MKNFGKFLVFLGTVMTIWLIVTVVRANYQYDNQVEYAWNVADRVSTIKEKSVYIDSFVQILNQPSHFGQNNALFFPTPSNSFDANYTALVTLKTRLHEIQTMDPSSFEYQTALQQITGQEMGEAIPMLTNIKGVWMRSNYFFAWAPIVIIQILMILISFIAGIWLWGKGAGW